MYQLLIIGIGMLLLMGNQSDRLFTEHFDYPDGEPPGSFWSEGNAVTIRNGRLRIDADTAVPRASSVWLDKEIIGDVSIEFDVYLLSSADDANNINVFFMYSDPSGKPLRQTAATRQDGLYRKYHQLNGFIVTNVTNGDTSAIRYRFRKNPGFKLMAEARQYRNIRGKKVHIKLIRKGNHFEYWEDRNKVLDLVSSEPGESYNKGLFGFRTWHTALEIDDLLIKRI
ncbi:hypothetical protein A8C56_23660 [Niabella ginsenosidivorans]|uniref:DUF6250 domain-containing protein n=1 Tax=Niabella ginsenosidivorans TaxID=1176587 RepID=A0A1A9IA07_9BACT|nr:DUF6250 domain-containing protein [Niabella ginsenosidivorans]ANH83570.1 hypothetical protein A8C56_23660 [Niabella ginsenosidivorans]